MSDCLYEYVICTVGFCTVLHTMNSIHFMYSMLISLMYGLQYVVCTGTLCTSMYITVYKLHTVHTGT